MGQEAVRVEPGRVVGRRPSRAERLLLSRAAGASSSHGCYSSSIYTFDIYMFDEYKYRASASSLSRGEMRHRGPCLSPERARALDWAEARASCMALPRACPAAPARERGCARAVAVRIWAHERRYLIPRLWGGGEPIPRRAGLAGLTVARGAPSGLLRLGQYLAGWAAIHHEPLGCVGGARGSPAHPGMKRSRSAAASLNGEVVRAACRDCRQI
jgi:hypothetical protein